MAQQTAVDWLVKHWKKLQAKGEKMTWQQVIDITELSKAMEKEQIKFAYNDGADAVVANKYMAMEDYYNKMYNYE